MAEEFHHPSRATLPVPSTGRTEAYLQVDASAIHILQEAGQLAEYCVNAPAKSSAIEGMNCPQANEPPTTTRQLTLVLGFRNLLISGINS
jgi:hypothetical protein